jgi:acylphosphatase
MSDLIARETIFEGRVQGVGFRYTCKELAKGFDLVGRVENLADGTVRLFLQGDPTEVEDYLHDLIEESALSHHIKAHTTAPKEPDPDLKGFQVQR